MTNEPRNEGKPSNEEIAAVTKAVASFNDLRQAIGRTDALVHAIERQFNEMTWPKDIGTTEADHLKHLIDTTCEATQSAILAVDRYDADMSEANMPGWQE